MKTPKVFVSYSHHDSKALAAFQPFLKSLERDGLVSCWDDTRLKGGDDWYAEIEQALAGASVAVLFISQHFLASDFIVQKELPRLLAREHAGQLELLPVFLSPSTVADEYFSFVDRQGKTHTIKLVRQHGYGTPQQPLSDRTWSYRQREYTKLSQRIRELAEAAAATAGRPDVLPASRVTSYPKPPPRATSASRAESINYELTVQLERRDETLVTRYYLPGSDAFAEAARPWSSLAAPPGSPSSIAAIAKHLDTQRGADLQRLLDENAGKWGEQLFDLLFGPESQWESVLRRLFERPAPTPRPNPVLAPVRLRIATDETLLLGLPWRLTAWLGTPLVDRGWEFSTGSVIDPRENPVTPAPAEVLIIAPQGGGGDGVAPDPTHVQAIKDVLQKVWPSRRQPPEYRRIVRTRSELDNALRGMHPHLIYVVGHGSIRGGQPTLLFDAAGGPDLPLTKLASSLRKSPARPAVIYLNVSGLASSTLTPVAVLAGVAPLLIWRRLPEREADVGGQASAWLQRWLQQGEDPLSALHQTSAGRPGADAATLAAHSNYRLWTINTRSSSAPGLPLLTLDRDDQKALVAKHLREFVRSDTGRVMALVAYAAPGNLLGSLPEQLQHYLDLEAADYAESNWRRLQFPVARQDLFRDLEHELKLQLQSDGSEAVRHLLRRHAPNVEGLAKRGVLWLNWGLFGLTAAAQPPFTPAQMSDWLHFSSQFLAVHCPDELRIVSFLAIELDAAKHQKLTDDLARQLRQTWCADPRFRLDRLPPLGSVTEWHLFDYLRDKGSGCDSTLRQEVAQRLVTRTGGEFAQVVALIEEAQSGSWYDLLEKLRREQDASPPPDNNDAYC